jgi:hypothetical protein
MKNLILCFIFAAFSLTSYAQFYDNDDEIVFYDLVDKTGYKYNFCDFVALNFAGNKAVSLSHLAYGDSYIGEGANALKDDLYYEKKVFDTSYKEFLSFNQRESSETEIIYDGYYSASGGLAWKFIFSYDRKRLTMKDPSSGGKIELQRITKQELYEKIRDARVEWNKSKSWRDRTSDNNTLYE